MLLVNSEEVQTGRFGAVLERELQKRPPEWPVYLEAGRELNWRDVVAVIDQIRGVGAEISLVTQ